MDDLDLLANSLEAMMKQDQEIVDQIEKAKRAVALLDLDDEAFELTLESETDTVDHCEMLAMAAVLAAADAEKNKALVDHYNRGKQSCLSREEKLRARIVKLIRATNRPNLATPTAMLSIRITESVEVDEINLVPTDYVKFEPKPLKHMIGLDLKAGTPVPGCRLVEKQSLTIKVK